LARPRKLRKVCDLPLNSQFAPLGPCKRDLETISMTVEEYETIRLIDLEGLTQEECAETMHVARTTVQRIYIEARKKLADFLVNGNMLNIEGGNYKLCKDREHPKGCGMCRRNRGRGRDSEEE
jgi:uncharacterized protein